MKAKKGFKLREICGESIIIAEGKENIDFTGIISMNETSSFLWKKIEGKTSFNEDELTTLLLENYDVERDTAASDVSELIKSWKKAGIIE